MRVSPKLWLGCGVTWKGHTPEIWREKQSILKLVLCDIHRHAPLPPPLSLGII